MFRFLSTPKGWSFHETDYMILFYCKLFLLFLWQLPQNLIAIIMLPFLGNMKLVRFTNYCWSFECTNMRGGISLGNFIYLSPSIAKKEPKIKHEYGHVKQSQILGWFYLFVIGIPSILNAIFGFTDCYYDWYTEKWANKLSGVSVGGNQHGCYLYIKTN